MHSNIEPKPHEIDVPPEAKQRLISFIELLIKISHRINATKGKEQPEIQHEV